MAGKVPNLNIENAKIMFKNFSGKEGRYNREGDRNFCVVIDDPEMAQSLLEDGWNVRILAPREEGEEPKHYIPVAVSYKFYPPNIMSITGHNKLSLDEDSVSTLDDQDIKYADIILRPYTWDDNGKMRIKAYLKTMYATIDEDAFAHKYMNMDEMPFD